MSERQLGWDGDYEYGRQAELWVEDVRSAFRTEQVEVKRDGRFAVTGNVYVEYEAWTRRHNRYEPSGIATTKAEVWAVVFGDSPAMLVVKTEWLRALIRRVWDKTHWHCEEKDGKNPTKGIALPVSFVLAALREDVEPRAAS